MFEDSREEKIRKMRNRIIFLERTLTEITDEDDEDDVEDIENEIFDLENEIEEEED